MNKIIWFLTTYLLILTLVPCADEGFHVEEKENQIEVHANNLEEQHKHDICTSLCACACCGTITNLQDVDVYSFINKINYKTFKIPQITHRFAGYNTAIWQPPKV